LKTVREDIINYTIEVFQVIEDVCYKELNNDETRNVLQIYLNRKKFTTPKDYQYFEYLCSEENNNEAVSPNGDLRVDIYMYLDEYADVITITYGQECNAFLNTEHILKF